MGVGRLVALEGVGRPAALEGVRRPAALDVRLRTRKNDTRKSLFPPPRSFLAALDVRLRFKILRMNDRVVEDFVSARL